MRTTSKIIVLALSIIVAIAAIMVYAKTQVQPPVPSKHTDQYNADLKSCFASFEKADGSTQEDSIFAVTADRIVFFANQKKISDSEADKNIDALLNRYVPLFLKRSFNKFLLAEWQDSDHNYMLSTISKIKSVKHRDNEMAVRQSSLDSLSTIEGIIGRYRKARILAQHKGFNGVSNAQNIISQANQYSKDQWLSHCSSLVASLQSVKTNIAQSHYNYIVAQVQKLSQYRWYSQSYYENTLVPQVDAAVTEYENRASALYGSRKNVDDLWIRARRYYNEASYYYEN